MRAILIEHAGDPVLNAIASPARHSPYIDTDRPVTRQYESASFDPSLIDMADLALALGTDLERGLGIEEAARQLQADGPNELRAVPPVPVWRRALAQLQDPLVFLFGAAAAVTLAAWWFEGRGRPGAAGWPMDAIVIAFVVVLNAVLGWLQEAKAAQACIISGETVTNMKPSPKPDKPERASPPRHQGHKGSPRKAKAF